MNNIYKILLLSYQNDTFLKMRFLLIHLKENTLHEIIRTSPILKTLRVHFPKFLPTEDSFHISTGEQSPVSVKRKSWYYYCPGLPQFPCKIVKVMKN